MFKECDFLFCWPTGAREDDDWDVAVHCMRSLGYRRIGHTNFLSYALDESHPSRHLATNLDPEPFPTYPEGINPGRHKILWTICKKSPSSTLDIFNKMPARTDWHAPDELGFTGIHIAAQKAQPSGQPWNATVEEQARGGCSCGSCRQGVLSPYMSVYLQGTYIQLA